MPIKSEPTHTFTNKQGKEIYCWSDSDNLIFSTARLDKGEGKYKSVSRSEEFAIVETATKLGLSSDQYKEILNEETHGTAQVSSSLYNENPNLRQLREDKQRYIMGMIDPKGKRINKIQSSMNELALLAGTVDNAGYVKANISEEARQSPPAQAKKTDGMFDTSVKIDKGKAHKKFYGKELKDEEPMVEGKDDRIILGKVNVSAQANGLYKIEVENLPGEDAFHAELYTAIQKYLNNKLQALKDSNPDVAAYENTTEGELSGKQGQGEGAPPEEGEVDLGFEAPPEPGVDTGAGEAVAGATGGAAPAPEAMEAPTA